MFNIEVQCPAEECGLMYVYILACRKFDDAKMHPRWAASFGVLANGDTNSPLPGYKFPVIVGETGSFLDIDKVRAGQSCQLSVTVTIAANLKLAEAALPC